MHSIVVSDGGENNTMHCMMMTNTNDGLSLALRRDSQKSPSLQQLPIVTWHSLQRICCLSSPLAWESEVQ